MCELGPHRHELYCQSHVCSIVPRVRTKSAMFARSSRFPDSLRCIDVSLKRSMRFQGTSQTGCVPFRALPMMALYSCLVRAWLIPARAVLQGLNASGSRSRVQVSCQTCRGQGASLARNSMILMLGCAARLLEHVFNVTVM